MERLALETSSNVNEHIPETAINSDLVVPGGKSVR